MGREFVTIAFGVAFQVAFFIDSCTSAYKELAFFLWFGLNLLVMHSFTDSFPFWVGDCGIFVVAFLIAFVSLVDIVLIRELAIIFIRWWCWVCP